jgi:hypothetical protein
MLLSGRFRRPARILDAATGGLSGQLARYKPQGSTILHHWQHSNSLWPGFFGVTSSPRTSLYPATSSLTDRSPSIPSEGISVQLLPALYVGRAGISVFSKEHQGLDH